MLDRRCFRRAISGELGSGSRRCGKGDRLPIADGQPALSREPLDSGYDVLRQKRAPDPSRDRHDIPRLHGPSHKRPRHGNSSSPADNIVRWRHWIGIGTVRKLARALAGLRRSARAFAPIRGMRPHRCVDRRILAQITRCWARHGTRPSAPHDQRPKSACIFEEIGPKAGKVGGEGRTGSGRGPSDRRSVIFEAERFPANVLPVVRAIQASGVTSFGGIAEAPNTRGIATTLLRPLVDLPRF